MKYCISGCGRLVFCVILFNVVLDKFFFNVYDFSVCRIWFFCFILILGWGIGFGFNIVKMIIN